MKFFAYFALFATASAIHLRQTSRTALETKDLPDLPPKAEKSLEKWAKSQLTTGEKTITKDEAEQKITAMDKRFNLGLTQANWDELEQMFDAADTNNDGQIDLNEFKAAMGH